MPTTSVVRDFMPCLSLIITKSSFFVSASPAPFSKNFTCVNRDSSATRSCLRLTAPHHPHFFPLSLSTFTKVDSMAAGGTTTGSDDASSYCTSDARWMLGLAICFYASPPARGPTMKPSCALIFFSSSVSSTAASHIIRQCINSAEVPVRTLKMNTC